MTHLLTLWWLEYQKSYGLTPWGLLDHIYPILTLWWLWVSNVSFITPWELGLHKSHVLIILGLHYYLQHILIAFLWLEYYMCHLLTVCGLGLHMCNAITISLVYWPSDGWTITCLICLPSYYKLVLYMFSTLLGSHKSAQGHISLNMWFWSLSWVFVLFVDNKCRPIENYNVYLVDATWLQRYVY